MAKKKSTEVAATPKMDEDWEARHAFDTLLRAAEITSNSTLMKKVKAHARTHKERADRVARLEGKLL